MNALVLGLALLAFGCAGPKEGVIPDGYTGPGAALADSVVYPEEGEMYQLFYVNEVDGDAVQNAMSATRKASAGHGSAVFAKPIRRAIPVKKMRVELVRTHYASMPIQ